MRIAYVTSHPIQYQAPLFRLLAKEPGVDLEVLFGHDHGVKASYDPGFGRVVQFDVPLLEGYSYKFLANRARKPSLDFAGQISPSVVGELRRFDAAIFHGYASVTNLLGLLARRRGRPAVLLRGESHLMQPRSTAKMMVRTPLLRALFTRVEHFLAIGTLNKAYYQSYGIADARITVAPYSVDNDYFVARSIKASARSTERAREGLPIDATIFLYCAKLIDKKRPLDAIRGLARARSAGPCHLVFIGDGPLRDACEQEAGKLGVADAVTFLGFRNQGELPRLYSLCDVLLLPSRDEPWGLVVNEAMASGLTVLASNRVGSTPDLVTDPETTFDPGDVETLGAQMARLAGDPAALETLKRSSTARIRQWSYRETVAGFVAGAHAAVTR